MGLYMNYSKGDASEILERLSSAYGVSTQKTLAEALEVPAANVSNWLQRNSVPGGAFVKCSLDTGADLRWLSTGEFENSNNRILKADLKGKELYERIVSSGGKAVLQRMLQAYGFKTQKELGDLLGIPTGTISTWIRRDFFPGDVVVACALDTGASLEWLAMGKGIAYLSTHESEQKNNGVIHIAKKTLKAGKLSEGSFWTTDTQFLPDDLISPILVQGGMCSWLVDFGVIRISNGRWLLDIDENCDIYDIVRLPGNRINIAGKTMCFECDANAVNPLGIVLMTIEKNN